MKRDSCFHTVPSSVEDVLMFSGSEIRSGHGVTHLCKGTLPEIIILGYVLLGISQHFSSNTIPEYCYV